MDPGIAGPLVVDVLSRATSQDTSVLKPAEEQLHQWESQPGFYSTLLTIFFNQNVDVNVRWLAVLYFKNGVDRYWRRLAPHALSEEEKTFVKQQLVSNFTEPVSQVATQLAVLIAKIARLDCPRQWPELIPTLLERVKSDTPIIQQRALLTLHHVIKALASKRLAPDRKMFEELTLNVFSFILALWNSHTGSFFQALQSQDAAAAVLCLDHSILALKVLRKLIVFGFKKPEESQDAISLISAVFQRLEEFLKAKNQMQILARELVMKREKMLNLLSKLILDFQEYHSEAFVQFIRVALEFTVRFNFTDEGQDLVFERFQVNAFNMMRSVLRCEFYRPAKTIEETKNPLTVEAYKMKAAFFTADTLSEICRRLLLHYFLLTQDDLDIWDADPEEFVCEEGGDSWKYSLRPCTENLYLTLIKEYRDAMTPVVLKLMEEYQSPVNPDDMPAILRKDAVLNAAGMASFDLYDDVDFDQWLTSSLLIELQNKHPNYRIIRRRIIWLLGCWIGVKLSNELRPTVYETLLPFLDQSEDMVVRIETAFTLRSAVDDFDFRIEQFSPYLERSFGSLFVLLKDASECETKMQILHVMSFIIERMKSEIKPYAGSLISYLPSLWQESADHNLLRCAILTALTNLVWGLGDVSVTMYDFLLPVIQVSTDVTSEQHIYLYEDGLELWLATVRSAPAVTEGLLQLYINMPPLLELGSETLQICLKIVESMILLGPTEFFQKYSQSLVSSLTSLLTDLRSEGVIIVYKVVELTLRVFADKGPHIVSSMLPEVLRAVLNEQEYPMVVGIKLAILSRIILQNQPFFFELVEEVSKEWNINSSELLGDLLDSWFDKMDNIVQPERRKLTSLALMSLLTCGVPAVLERFAGIINVVVESLHDVCRAADDGESTEQDCFVLSMDNSNNLGPDDELETEHDKRKLELNKLDPVYNTNLKTCVFQQLNTCQQQHGTEAFEKMMETVDSEIVHQLKHFMR